MYAYNLFVLCKARENKINATQAILHPRNKTERLKRNAHTLYKRIVRRYISNV